MLLISQLLKKEYEKKKKQMWMKEKEIVKGTLK